MKVFSLLALGCVFSSSAFAIDFGALKEKVKAEAATAIGACKDDKVKFCDKYKTLDEIKTCLKTNKDSLSAGCKSALHI